MNTDVVALEGVQLDGHLAASVNAALVLLITAAPLLTADLAAPVSNAARRVLPGLGIALAIAVDSFASACHTLRLQREMLFMLLHGALTYATGDLIAQYALSRRKKRSSAWTQRGPEDPPSHPDTGQRRPCRNSVSLRPLRSARAALAGILSDTLPFYSWSVALVNFEHSKLAHRFPLFQRKPSLLLASKVAVHLATFQPFTSAVYLMLQPLLRGESFSTSLKFMRSKFLAAYAPAFATFLLGGPVIYSIRSIILQGALRNLGVLAISVYLAMLSSNTQ